MKAKFLVFLAGMVLLFTACSNGNIATDISSDITATSSEENSLNVVPSEENSLNGETLKIYEDTFSGLIEFIIENGKAEEIDEQSCYTVSFELEDYYALDELKISAITESDIIYVQGSTLHYLEKSKDYATFIIHKDGTFEFKNDFDGETSHSIYMYEISVDAYDYTKETEFSCLRYDAETNELLDRSDVPNKNNYGRNKYDVNNLLNRTAISLSTINFSLDSLGFSSYEPDMEQAKKNKGTYDMQVQWKDQQIDDETSVPHIGMTKSEVLSSAWGAPTRKNIHEYSWGIYEQWVYQNQGYIYFENGIVTSISRSE